MEKDPALAGSFLFAYVSVETFDGIWAMASLGFFTSLSNDEPNKPKIKRKVLHCAQDDKSGD